MVRPCPDCGAGPEHFGKGAHYCLPCAAARRRASRRGPRKNPSPRPGVVRELLEAARKRAKAKGLPFTLTVANTPPIPSRCPVLGLELRRGVGRLHDASPSLDRLRASWGYVPGNVRWVSHRYNRLRSDMTIAEAEAILADLLALGD